MIARLAVPLAFLALGACANMDGRPGEAPVPIEQAAITYSTQPCFGTCPVYSVTVTPDGKGTFTGGNHTTVEGEKAFTIDAATYRRFADHLAAVKPAEGDRLIHMGTPDCGNAPTDMPGIEVRWNTNTGAAPQTLGLYLGCRSPEADRVKQVLLSAPDLLPIAQYIGKR